MSKLPEFNPIVKALEHRTIEQRPRPYLGMSQLGHACDRYLVYYFRRMFIQYLTPQKMRIFERGDLEEPRIIRDLTQAGIMVFGTQDELIGFAGHCKGHIDGEALGVPGAPKTEHLLEFKTMKDSKFKEFKKKGLEKSHPGYWVQIHTYADKKGLSRILFVVTNKDTEERAYKRYHTDKSVAESAHERSVNIITAESLPDKIAGPDYFECKWCAAFSICHGTTPPERNCRTCRHVEIENNGGWFCTKHEKKLNDDKPCKNYDDNPSLVSDGSEK